jgi:hypothetical protein
VRLFHIRHPPGLWQSDLIIVYAESTCARFFGILDGTPLAPEGSALAETLHVLLAYTLSQVVRDVYVRIIDRQPRSVNRRKTENEYSNIHVEPAREKLQLPARSDLG